MVSHPYYPLDLELPGYVENTIDLTTLLLAFSAGVACILGTALIAAHRYRPSISKHDQFLVLWFVLSGSLHCFFEAYFLWNHTRMPAVGDLFGQLWKEYAKSDSRYMTADPLVLTLEIITVFVWGPLSFLTAWSIMSDSPFRFPFQALVATGHLYSCTLYFVMAFIDMTRGVIHSRPEKLYFWVYFVAMNAPWIVVPAFTLYQAITGSARAVTTTRESTARSRVSGSAKEHTL
ncbi:putative EBP domain protein [Macrophomina phaseolina]|uniref:EBP domain protein n=1 Tax=Macrophomina phaseolina TaxID=35725 RepID=A0ABQ8FR81_9PEZI|nr:putative EBP domain protein [Macrophomina phaseolina]